MVDIWRINDIRWISDICSEGTDMERDPGIGTRDLGIGTTGILYLRVSGVMEWTMSLSLAGQSLSTLVINGKWDYLRKQDSAVKSG